MPDPNTPTGPNDPNQAELEVTRQRLGALGAELSSAAALGGEAFREALKTIQEEVELRLKPAINSLGKLPKETVREFDLYKRQLKDIEKVHKDYYNTVATEEQRKISRIKDGLDRELLETKKHYASLVAAAKDNQEEIVRLQKEEAQQLAQAEKRGAGRISEATSPSFGLGAFSQISGQLAGLASIGKLVDTLFRVGQAEFQLGGAVGRITGQPATTAGGAKALGQFGGLMEFGGLSPETGSQLLAKSFGAAPQLMKQALDPALVPLLNFGVNIEDAMALITEGSAAANITVEELTDNLAVSTGAAKQFGVDILHSMTYMLDFTKSIKMAGVDTETATKRAQAWTTMVENIGKNMGLGQEEMSRFAGKLEGVIQSMAPSKAYGLLLATTGKAPTDLGELGKKVTEPTFFKNLYQMFERGAGGGGLGKMLAPEAFGQALGIQVDIQTAQMLQNMMKAGAPPSLSELREKGLQSMDSNIRDARVSLKASQDYLQIIATAITQTIAPAAAPLAGLGRLLGAGGTSGAGLGAAVGYGAVALGLTAAAPAAAVVGGAAVAGAALGFLEERSTRGSYSNKRGDLGSR